MSGSSLEPREWSSLAEANCTTGLSDHWEPLGAILDYCIDSCLHDGILFTLVNFQLALCLPEISLKSINYRVQRTTSPVSNPQSKQPGECPGYWDVCEYALFYFLKFFFYGFIWNDPVNEEIPNSTKG